MKRDPFTRGKMGFYRILLLLLMLAGGIPASLAGTLPPTSGGAPINCTAGGCTATMLGNPGQAKIALLAIVILMASFYFSRKYIKKSLFLGGITLSIFIGSFLFFAPTPHQLTAGSCQEVTATSTGVLKDTAAASAFLPSGNDFEPMAEPSKSPAAATVAEQPAAAFQETKPAGDEFAVAGGEFSSSTDEFKSMDATEIKNDASGTASGSDKLNQKRYKLLYELAVLFTLLIIIRYLIRYEAFRKTRGLFLLASVVYLGFYNGACPCMILSFQNTVLSLLGEPIDWISMVWFLGLIPLTYFFGKIWCGWLCHLGGLQDFLFQAVGIEVLKSNKSQTILRYIRMALLVMLILQLIITRTNIYIHYDPFKVAFNLISANKTGYFLLVILLVSSVLIYRPFCRAVCPVGLILGWIALLPGATRLSKKENCTDCSLCQKSCRNRSMLYEEKKSILNVQDCILCGDCMGSCKKSSLYINRKRI